MCGSHTVSPKEVDKPIWNDKKNMDIVIIKVTNMDTDTLPTRRPFSKKVFVFLLLLIVPAAYAALPYMFTVMSVTLDLEGWLAALGATLVDVAIYGLLAAGGLYLAAQIGLGLPFVEGWLEKELGKDTPQLHVIPVEETMRDKFMKVFIFSVVVGIIVVSVIIALDMWIFMPAYQAELESLGRTIPEVPVPPVWQRILAAFSGGINEEVIFHLFGLSVVAWLGSQVFHDSDGRPTLSVLWVANILIALVFGLAHLPLRLAIGLPLTPLLIARVVMLPGIAGAVFGWLYWTRGLESAMVAHFSANIAEVLIAVLVLQSL